MAYSGSFRTLGSPCTAVGQQASLSKCVLLSTCKGTRKKMKNWAISAGEGSWGTKLDLRDLGGHLNVTLRARAGTLSLVELAKCGGVLFGQRPAPQRKCAGLLSTTSRK